jgi:hypothetical protein
MRADLHFVTGRWVWDVVMLSQVQQGIAMVSRHWTLQLCIIPPWTVR